MAFEILQKSQANHYALHLHAIVKCEVRLKKSVTSAIFEDGQKIVQY